MFLLLIAGIILHFVLIKDVLFKYILKADYSLDKYLGRGIKRFTLPDGRGVLYEPHPSARKYIRKYTLYAMDGYKYLQCKTDKKIGTLSYSVVMLNNRNRIIDTLSITEDTEHSAKTQPVMLHPETSYIALVLESVDGLLVNSSPFRFYKLYRILLLALSVAVLSFAELFAFSSFACFIMNKFLSMSANALASMEMYILIAAVSAVVFAAAAVANGYKNGIRVAINDKK
jgi:hypothetical protein